MSMHAPHFGAPATLQQSRTLRISQVGTAYYHVFIYRKDIFLFPFPFSKFRHPKNSRTVSIELADKIQDAQLNLNFRKAAMATTTKNQCKYSPHNIWDILKIIIYLKVKFKQVSCIFVLFCKSDNLTQEEGDSVSGSEVCPIPTHKHSLGQVCEGRSRERFRSEMRLKF